MDTLLSLYLFLACLSKAVVCASRDLPVQAVCVFMWSLLRREGIDYIQAFLSPPPPSAQDIQVNVSIVSECMAECLRQASTAWYSLTLTFKFKICDMGELISQPPARRGGLGPSPSLSSAVPVLQMMPQ